MLKSAYNFFYRLYHRRYHGVYRHAKKLFVFDLALLAVALVMLAGGLFFFFWKPGLLDLVDLNISFSGERVLSGENITLTVSYANRTKYPFQNVYLSVHLPPGFEVDRAQTPESEFSAQSVFAIGEVPPGGKGTKKISGRVWTQPKNDAKITALFSYEAAGYGGPEQKISSAILTLPASVIAGTLTAPAAVFAGQDIPLTLTVRNTSDVKVEGLNIIGANARTVTDAQTGTDDVTNANASATANPSPLSNFSLAPGENREFTLAASPGATASRGTPNASSLSSAVAAAGAGATAQITITKTVDGVSLPQQILSANVKIIRPALSVAAKANLGTSYAEAGTSVPVSVTWQNNGGVNFKNLKIKIRPTAGTVNMSAAARENNLKLIDGALVADAANRTALASAVAGQSGQIELTLPLLSTFSLDEIENAQLEIQPFISGETADAPGQTFENKGEAAVVPLATEISFTTEARYYTDEGDQLGRGPLPVQANETTKYWIFARAENTTNALEDVRFEARLPVGVEFTGKQSVTIGPKISYTSSNRTARWSYVSLPPHSVTGLYFEVSVTPTAQEIAAGAIELLENALFTATDSFTKKSFEIKKGALTDAKVK